MAKLIPTGMDSVTGQFNISKTGDTLFSPPMIGIGGTPTLSVTAALGTSGTATIVGNNISGIITVNSGILSLAAGKIVTMTFANGFSFPNGSFVHFTAANGNFASVLTKLYAIGLTNTVELYVNLLALSASTTYVGHYLITGY